MPRPAGPTFSSRVRKGVVSIPPQEAPKVRHNRVAVLQTSQSKEANHDLTVVAIE